MAKAKKKGASTEFRAGYKAALDAAIAACKNEQQSFGSTQYATHQPASSMAERFACGCCIEAIAALEPKGE